MNFKRNAIVAAFAFSLMASHSVLANSKAQKKLDNIANAMTVNVASLQHQPKDTKAQCPGGYCYRAAITITNSSKKRIGNDWEMYFSNLRRVLDTRSDLFTIEHVNGDLHKIVPTKKFKGLKAGQSVSIEYDAEHWEIVDTDFMPRYYVVADNAKARVIKNTLPVEKDAIEDLSSYLTLISDDPKQPNMWQRHPDDSNIIASSRSRFDDNRWLADLGAKATTASIIPSPVSLKVNAGQIDISAGLQLSVLDKSLTGEQVEALNSRLQLLGVTTNNGLKVKVSVNPKDKAFSRKEIKEAYKLSVSAKGIEVVGADQQGAFYGVQSLASLINVGSDKLAKVEIDYDAPRFEYRGMHMDVSRNFKSKALVLKFLDQMAAYKMNKFHFHLADDEGWRLEIPGLPELTDVGANRCHDLTERTCILPQLGSGPDTSTNGSGYYSVADYAEILAYADARNIQVIPSMDMPGHSRAAVKAMEARYKNFAEKGDMKAAEMYLLTDSHDGSQYFSVQNYTDNTINPCMESSFVFMDKVISEIVKQHKNAGQALTDYHIGADETSGAWVDSPVCRAMFVDPDNGIDSAADLGEYFISRISHILATKELNLAAWNDGLKHGKYMDPNKLAGKTMSYSWATLFWGGTNEAHEMANAGCDVILSLPEVTYFDHPYEVDPKEGGNYWGARYTNTQKVFNFMPENLPANAETMTDRDNNQFAIPSTTLALEKGVAFKGMQGHIWTEMIRTDTQLESRVFPRMLAMAERAWSQAEWELEYDEDNSYKTNVAGHKGSNYMGEKRMQLRDKQWQQFANNIGYQEFAKLDAADILYRLPVPGAITNKQGLLEVNTPFPGVQVQYSFDGKKWVNYNKAKKPTVKPNMQVRSIAKTGRAGRAITVK